MEEDLKGQEEGVDLQYRNGQPLEIPHILSLILGHLPLPSLLQTRLVSHQFNEECSRLLRKRTKIVISSTKTLMEFHLQMEKGCNNLLQPNTRFCDTFQTINCHLHTPGQLMFSQQYGPWIKGYQLVDCKWTIDLLESFLKETFVQLSELTIHGAIPRGSGQLFGGADTPSLKLPNIKVLDLQLYEKDKSPPPPPPPRNNPPPPPPDTLRNFTLSLLQATCNLEVIASSTFPYQDDKNNRSSSSKGIGKKEKFKRLIFDLLISGDLSVTKLRKISFPISPWNDEQLRKFNNQGFPLEYLKLTVLPDISVGSLVQLLISLKDTLKKLKLSFSSWRIVEFPQDLELPKLQHLSLDWFNGSLKFLKGLKNLRTLILAEIDVNEVFGEEGSEGLECPSTSTLEIYQQSGPVVGSKTVCNIHKIFPKLKDLALGKLDDESLRTIFQCFPNLQTLSAIEGAYTDYGVIGVDKMSCEKCGKEHLREICKGIYNEELINKRKKYKSIGDMKDLTRLTLKSPHLSNLSVIHGVAFCQRLKYLSLWSCEMTFFSLRRIVDTMDLDYLETTHTFCHIAEIRYALLRMKGKKFILNGMTAPTSNPLQSSETKNFLAEFHDNVCRSVITYMKQRTYLPPPCDHDLLNNRQTSQNNLHLIYEACNVVDNLWNFSLGGMDLDSGSALTLEGPSSSS